MFCATIPEICPHDHGKILLLDVVFLFIYLHMRIFYASILGICTIFFGNHLFAQNLEVTNAPPITPQNLITNIFLGDGVEVLNVSYQGSNNSVGFFKTGQNAVGMERGIVMTTGRAVTAGLAFGVAEPGSAQASVDNQSNVSDPDLDAIAAGEDVFNVTKYEITFIPISDTLRFRYAFASEEYPEFVCSEFNDIFGFFISGPGINGPFQNNAINIARIPGTNLPVTINNVNSGQVGNAGELVNCTPPRGSLAYGQYYNDNDDSPNFPIYDGITDVFTAEAIVQPCQIYTIKLVICDVGDAVYDSGVFLEAKSFGTGSLDVQVATASLDGSIAEGCAVGRLAFSLPNPVESPYYIDYSLFGEAVNGIDYAQLPDSLFIPAGESSVFLDIIAFEDGIVEGSETLLIDVQRDACNRDTFQIMLRDNPLLKPDLGPDTLICAGSPVQLNGAIPIVLPPPPTFRNTNNTPVAQTNVPVFSNINVNGVIPGTLSPAALQSICIDSLSHQWIDDLDIFLITPGGQFLELSTDNGGNGGNGLALDFIRRACFTPSATTRINFPGPLAPPSALPFTGNWLPEGEWNDIWGGPTNGQWRLQLIDDTNSATGTLHSWSITFNRTYDIQYDWINPVSLSCTSCPDPIATPTEDQEYILSISDSYGCTTSDTIFMEAVPALDAPLATCADLTANAITVSWLPVAGASGYEVNVNNSGWQQPSGNNLFTVAGLNSSQTVEFFIRAMGLCPGTIDTLQCQTLACTPPNLAAEVINATCAGRSDGAVSLSSANAVGTLSYELNGQTNSSGVFTGLGQGQYVATLTDEANCPASVSFEIDAPQALSFAPLLVDSISCAGNADGSATVTVSGGQAPYLFLWDNGEQTPIAVALNAGIHTVTITDQSGCSGSVEITAPEPQPLTLTLETTDVSCAAASNGTAAAQVNGGTGPFTFQWSTPMGIVQNPVVSGLSGGGLPLTVTDANGCTAEALAIIREASPIQLQSQITPARCYGQADGTATLIASGGTGNFSFAWNNGLSGSSQAALAAGTYQVTATDAAGCEEAIQLVILQPDAPLSVSWEITPLSCFQSDNGSATASIAGGTPGYTLQWENLPPNSQLTRTGMPAGLFAVTISDANNCTLTDEITLQEPPLLEVSLQTTEVLCFNGNDGSAVPTPTGGTSPYQFDWSNGQQGPFAENLTAGPVSVTITDANGCQTSATATILQPTELTFSLQSTDVRCFGASDGSASLTISGGVMPYNTQWSQGAQSPSADMLSAGDYQFTITDGNNCTTTGSVQIAQPSALTSAMQSGSASCAAQPDGTAQISVSGGTMPYSYRWNDPAEQETPAVSGLNPGWYTVTVVDAQQCILLDSVLVADSPAVLPELQVTAVRCFGGSDGRASVVPTGGTPPFQYTWSAPGIGNNPTATGLSSGIYTVTVTDIRQCQAIVQIDIAEPAPLSAIATPRHIACAGNPDGSIELTVTGGVSPYRFLWNNGDIIEDPFALQSGFYSVTITDANDCTFRAETTIIQTTPIVTTFTTDAVDCYGEATGSAAVVVRGGAPPYVLEWSNGATGARIENVISGEYVLAITDSLGCRIERTVLVPQPEAPLSVVPEILPPSCFGETDGRIELVVEGGTPGYVFQLNDRPFSGNRIFISLAAGVYSATIRDANECLFVLEEIILPTPDSLVVNLGPDITIPYGDSLQLNPVISGAVDPILWVWSPDDSLFFSCLSCQNPVIRPRYQQAVILRVMDSNGCEGEDIMTVFVEKNPRAYVPTGFTPNGDGQNDRLLVHGRSGTRVLTFRVFDRWGQLLYEGGDFWVNDDMMGWDGSFRGSPVEGGVYLWSLSVELSDGGVEQFSGATHVIR